MSARLKHAVATAMVGASVMATVPAAADDMFIKIDGIKGDSVDAKHAGEIDVMSWSWGASSQGAFTPGGGGATRVTFQNLTITKKVDSSSPNLLLSAAQGLHRKDLMLVARGTGTKAVEYLRIKLSDVIVTGIKLSGTAASATGPVEEVTFTFGACEYAYAPPKADGSKGAEVKMAWNVAKNAPQ